jgi:hypothetical protein
MKSKTPAEYRAEIRRLKAMVASQTVALRANVMASTASVRRFYTMTLWARIVYVCTGRLPGDKPTEVTRDAAAEARLS